MKKLLVFAMVLASANSFALTSRLAFQVRSSGPDAFPCNAGIRHLVTTDTDGYRMQKPSCPTGVLNCVNGFETETGVHGGRSYTENDNSVAYNPSYGIYLPDFLKGHVKLYNPLTGLFETSTLERKKANTSGWNSIFASDLTEGSKINGTLGDLHRVGSQPRKNKVLSDLVFLLATEQYGTEYFVDICNYQPELYNTCAGEDCYITSSDMSLSPDSHWSYEARVSGKSESILDYIVLSGLTVRAELWCDGVLKKSSSEVSAQSDFFQILSYDLGKVPAAKCVTRFFFKETRNTKMRLNETQNGCFEVETIVNEGEEANTSFSNMF